MLVGQAGEDRDRRGARGRRHLERPAGGCARPRDDRDARGQAGGAGCCAHRRVDPERRPAQHGTRIPARQRRRRRSRRRSRAYFDAIATIWKDRSYSIASYILQFFYPGPLASQSLVDATNAWLDAEPRRAGAAPSRHREPRRRRARAGRTGTGPPGLMELMRLGDAGAETPVVRVDGATYSIASLTDDIDGAFLEGGGIAKVRDAVAAGSLAVVRGRRSPHRRTDRAPPGDPLHRAELRRPCGRVGQPASGAPHPVPQAPEHARRAERRRPRPSERDPGRLGGRARRGDRHAGALSRLPRGRPPARRRICRQQRRIGADLPAGHLGRPVVEGQELRDLQPARPGPRPRRRGGPAGAPPLVARQRRIASGFVDGRHDLLGRRRCSTTCRR